MSSVNLTVLCRDLLNFDCADVAWDADSGQFVDASGHIGVFTRGADLASVQDVTGDTYTAQPRQPAWEMNDWNGTRDAFTCRMGTSDRFVFATNVLPQAMHGLCEFVEAGSANDSGETLLALTNDAATGAGIYWASGGSRYRMVYSNGISDVQADIPVTAPAIGARVLFVWELSASGALDFRQQVNGGTWRSDTTESLSLPTAWASGASWRINRRGATANPAEQAFRRVVVRAGPLDLDSLLLRR